MHEGAGSRVKLCAQGLGFRLYSSLFPVPAAAGHSSCSCGTPGQSTIFFQKTEEPGPERGLGFDLVSTSGLKIASCPAQEEQESLTSPLTMGKSSFAKKSKARIKSVTCQGPFCHSLSLCLSLLANGEGYLERGRLTHSWFSAQGSERLP